MHYLIIAVLAFGLSLMGCEGKTGPAGPSGSTGAAGPAGPAGPQGSTGPQGATGPQGEKGDTGETGPAGPAGADGAKGDKGDPGETGPAGPAGETGPAGPAGETGPAGPAGETGPAGPAGETGPAGPAGETGPEGPQGPAGIPDNAIELAQADHIAIAIGDGDKAKAPVMLILRVGEERAVKAAARSQSEKILESIPVTLAIHKNEDDAITLEDGMLTAVGAGKATVRAESELAGISGDIKVTVTNPVDKITFSPSTSPIFLAAGQENGEVTATAVDKDGNMVEPRTGENWDWASEDKTVASVTKKKVGDDVKDNIGIITAVGEGETMITATFDGVTGSIEVSVTGQTKTTFIRASTSNNGNEFVYDLGAESPAWNYDNSVFQVFLYDIVSNDRIAGTVTVESSDPNLITVSSDQVIATGPGLAAPPVTVSPAAATGMAMRPTQAVVTLTAPGADPVRILFTVQVKAATTP